MTNCEFSETNLEFRKACAAAGIEPTGHQAAKFRHRRGAAYWLLHGLARVTPEGRLELLGRDYQSADEQLLRKTA